MVMAGLGPVKEALVALAGEEEATCFRVLELRQQRLGQLGREGQILRREARLQELEQRRDEVRVVVQVSVEVRASVLVRGKQLAAAPHAVTDELERLSRGSDPFGPAEHAAGVRHAADGERVPGDEHLLVAPRPHALLARREELGARRFHQGLLLRWASDAQVPVPLFEVRRAIEAVARYEGRELLR